MGDVPPARTHAPVVLIAFNRPDHFRRTLEALAENPGAGETDVYLYLDGPRQPADHAAGDAICACAEQFRNGFKSLRIERRPHNLGLADNITSAVTAVVNAHGRVIVLEDDIVTSPAFLAFMNDALDYYDDVSEIWHVGATTDVNDPKRPNDVFLWRYMMCWGWATWADRWRHFEKDVDQIIGEFSPRMIKRFTLDGVSDSWEQILGNKSGSLNTWAIFWYATIFRNGGLCVSPYLSYATNIGFDGSGMHTGTDQVRQAEQPLNVTGVFRPETALSENRQAVIRQKQFFVSLKRRHGHRGPIVRALKMVLPQPVVSSLGKLRARFRAG